MTILSKNAIFRPNIELEAIARQSVDASREVDCAYFGNIGRNSGYFLLPIFLGSYLNGQAMKCPLTVCLFVSLVVSDQIVHKIWICPGRFLPVLHTFLDPGGTMRW